MGVCPQFDILWDELTIREHLTLFSRIKSKKKNKKKNTILLQKYFHVI